MGDPKIETIAALLCQLKDNEDFRELCVKDHNDAQATSLIFGLEDCNYQGEYDDECEDSLANKVLGYSGVRTAGDVLKDMYREKMLEHYENYNYSRDNYYLYSVAGNIEGGTFEPKDPNERDLACYVNDIDTKKLFDCVVAPEKLSESVNNVTEKMKKAIAMQREIKQDMDALAKEISVPLVEFIDKNPAHRLFTRSNISEAKKILEPELASHLKKGRDSYNSYLIKQEILMNRKSKKTAANKKEKKKKNNNTNTGPAPNKKQKATVYPVIIGGPFLGMRLQTNQNVASPPQTIPKLEPHGIPVTNPSKTPINSSDRKKILLSALVNRRYHT
jgi:hypothetical protein